MTLFELCHDCDVQGNVRISAWKDHDEIILLQEENVDPLDQYVEEAWEDADVLYMFCSSDGYLHIEVDPDGISEEESEDKGGEDE